MPTHPIHVTAGSQTVTTNVPVSVGPTKTLMDVVYLRTDSRAPDVLLRAHADAFGRPWLRQGFICGSYDSAFGGPGQTSPIATVGFWVGGTNHNLDEMARLVDAAGIPRDRVVIDSTFPILLRGQSNPPKNPTRAEEVREDFLKVAAGTYKFQNNKDFLLECVEPYAAAVAAASIKYGFGVTMRAMHEGKGGFNVYPNTLGGWTVSPGGDIKASDGIVNMFGTPITEAHRAKFHRDPAFIEGVAAYKRVADIFAQHGVPMTFCSDKRPFDTIHPDDSYADGEFSGRVIGDVSFELLGEYIRDSGGTSPLGPSYWGGDMYTESHMSEVEFNGRYRPVLDYYLAQGRLLGLKFASSEWGDGSGREDEEEEGGPADTTVGMDLRFDWIEQNLADIGMIVLYHPNNTHNLQKQFNPKRRLKTFTRLGRAPHVNKPIYEFELAL